MKFWWRWLSLWLLLGFGLRGFMYQVYPEGAFGAGLFLAGAVNDLQSYFIVAGAVALAGLWSQRWLRVAGFVALVAMLVVLVAEVFFWLEFESRLDRLVFHYLAYPKEVVVFLEEQFFLSLFILPLLLLSWLLMALLRWPQVSPRNRPLQIGIGAVGLVVVAFGQPLGQSASRVNSEFASNGYLGVLVDARYQENDVPWLADAPSSSAAAMPVSLRGFDFARAIRQQVAEKKHVVLIIEESFAGPVWEDRELRQRYLPNFSQLAQESLSFTNLYASGSRTTRGMEALLNGFPPLPGISTTERANYTRLPSLARGMQDGGFYPVFLYGGWPGFSNFSTYWRSMGFQQLWSRHDFDENFETSWGVSDEALFERLITEMNTLAQQQERVFLATLTVSHHRPYDFPEHSVPFPASERRSEYAMAYADHALGDFFAAVRQTDWYDDTIFIVAADHGLYPHGAALIPVNSYHIPLLIHGTGIAPREMQHLGSSVSLPKTLMSLLRINSEENFGGEDLLCDCDTIVPVEAGYHIGLLDRDQLHVLTRQGDYETWSYDLNSRRLTHQPSASAQGGVNFARSRVLNAFAPAYQWYYDVSGTQRDLAGVHHVDVAGE